MAPKKQSQTKQKEQENQQNSGIDWGVIQGGNQEFLDIYPRIQWMHGDKKLKQAGGLGYKGGLFIPEDQFTGFEAEHWEETTIVAGEGSELKGWWSSMGLLAVIRSKRFWYDGTSRNHFLVCIKGVDGLFSLQVKGMSKGVAMEQAFNQHRAQVVSFANRMRPEGTPILEPFALWFAVHPGEHETAYSKNDPSKSSVVTPPKLYLPNTINEAYINRLWVGLDNYKRFVDLYKETESWQEQIPKQRNNTEFSGPDKHEEDYTPTHRKPFNDADYEQVAQPGSQAAAVAPASNDDIPF